MVHITHTKKKKKIKKEKKEIEAPEGIVTGTSSKWPVS